MGVIKSDRYLTPGDTPVISWREHFVFWW